jgi:hypothetical protein
MAFDNISLSEKQSSENEGEVKKRQISFYYKKSRGVHTNSQNLSVFGSNAASRAVMREKKKACVQIPCCPPKKILQKFELPANSRLFQARAGQRRARVKFV